MASGPAQLAAITAASACSSAFMAPANGNCVLQLIITSPSSIPGLERRAQASLLRTDRSRTQQPNPTGNQKNRQGREEDWHCQYWHCHPGGSG